MSALTEQRDLKFSPKAVCEIVAQSPVAAYMLGLPAGSPIGICLSASGSHVLLVYNDGLQTEGFMLTAESLGALIFIYCSRANIPMPRFSNKSISVTDEEIILSLVLKLDALPKATTPERVIENDKRSGRIQPSKIGTERIWPA